MDVMNENRSVIAERLRLAREMAGLSQGQVAKMLSLHRPSISEMEAGRRKVSAEELRELGRIYGTSVAWLTATEDSENDPHLAKVQLVARELQKLKPEDLDRLMNLLVMFRTNEE